MAADKINEILIVFRHRKPIPEKSFPLAYNNTLPISRTKKKDLHKLCSKQIIPREVHQWFNELPDSDEAKDQFPEPAIKDSREEEN